MKLAGAAAARVVPLVPRRLARGASARYIAGETVEEAVRIATHLKAHGLLVTLDVLGEDVTSEVKAAEYAAEYLGAFAALEEAGLQPHMSVKPSSLGSLFDWHLCKSHLIRIAEAAAAHGGLVCIDMECAEATDGTLDLYREMRKRFTNVTMVVQARLHRTRRDLVALAPLLPHVRICKGIYPERRHVAYSDPEAIRRNYLFCLKTLLESGGYAAIATHDEALIVASLERLAHHSRRPGTYEFQMLLGVRQDLAESLAAAGHQVRIYVPFGADWHRYAVRRLQENPEVLSYVIQAQVRSFAQASRDGWNARRPTTRTDR